MTSNLMQWFDTFYPPNDKANWIVEVVELWDKVTWWAKFNKNFLEAWLVPWLEEKALNLFFPHRKSWHPMDNHGDYGVMCKVWIEIFDHIPITIELIGKTPKTYDKQKTRKQHSVKASVCQCEHPSVIKFPDIHFKTIEACTLWWNEGTLWKLLDYNTKYSPLMDNQVYCGKGRPIWKGEDNLLPLSEIVWSWNGHSWTSWM